MSADQNNILRDPTASVQLSRRIQGIIQTQLIYVAARLRLADLLKDGNRSVVELAALTGTTEPRLYRTMRALASLGIFVESTPGHFAMTPLAIPLQSDAPDSVRDLALMVGSQWHVRAWANILHSLQAEESAFENVFGMDLFNYLDNDREAAESFDNAMTFTSQKQAHAICQAYDFSDVSTIVDVGGGQGFLICAILKAYPGPRGILFERPRVAKTAKTLTRAQGVDARCKVLEGDFFSDVPTGADLYILKYILHDWDDTDAASILENCRQALAPDGRLLVIDAAIPASLPPFEQTALDIEMMVMLHNGRERTEAEFAALFSRTRFRLNKIISTRCNLSILEALPIL